MARSARGVVASFDFERGLGTVREDDGAELSFHCVEIADGSRTIEVGARVEFEVEPGRLGQLEARRLRGV